MRTLPALLVLLTASAAAQPAAHVVPFGSSGNVLELVLDGADAGAATVAVVSAPAWLAVAQEARAEAGADGHAPVARLAFDARRTAPVGVPGEVVVEVRAGGAVVGRHAVRVEVGPPSAVALRAPRPNPTSGPVVVGFEVPTAGVVRVAVYDVLGREVAVLADGPHAAGAYEASVPGRALASGVYAVRLTVGGEARAAPFTVAR